MEKEFIPYKQALALKELGFDEPCLAQWDEMELYPLQQGGESAYFETNKNSRLSFNTMAPTFSQAFRWFREKYGLHINKTGNNNYTSFNITEPKVELLSFVRHTDTKNHYEEAEIECLSKLIEIVKSK